ncbi:rhomboid family intramembrane serine protease [Paracoccus sp. YIM 132242]|uniref:Rhomboid family intramembrane serine protease n=1 Tax=Paracoccus lichenicola TaxID=2665644 RepID=A0A6L6HLQ3_9RHOB|nr:rhomboid family intramembrane serine protease [Paracoccus lichenicola]MTE00106.1 rhomboid family intramembrane serine protease [Paracoccus lichenicola]
MVARSEPFVAMRDGSQPRLPLWVRAVIVLCCGVQAAVMAADLMGYPIARQAALIFGGFWSPVVWAGHGIFPGHVLTMFLTYGFLHAGLLHLGMNMLSLVALARELNRLIGPRRMALVYAVTQVAAALLFAAMTPDGGPMIGASGAIFGLAGALIGFAAVSGWRRRRPLGQLWRGVALMVVLNVALTVLMPSIAWEAHLGGIVAGLVMGAAMALTGSPRSSAF